MRDIVSAICSSALDLRMTPYYYGPVAKERAEINVAAIVVTDEKAEYIRTVHGVERADVLAVFAKRPRYFIDGRGRFAMIGSTLAGRLLLAAIMPVEGEEGSWRLVTAHWPHTRQGRTIYGED
jgi:hypothetical protein